MSMANLPRRRLLVSSGAVLALAACTGSPNAGNTPAQVIADANGLITSLGQVVNTLAQQPNVLSPALVARSQMLLAEAGTLASSLGTTVAANTAAPVLDQIEKALGSVLGSLSALALVPPYGTIVAAATALLPVITAFVQQYVPGKVGAREVTAGVASKARSTLGIPTVAR